MRTSMQMRTMLALTVVVGVIGLTGSSRLQAEGQAAPAAPGGRGQAAGGRGGQAPIRDNTAQASPLGTGTIAGTVSNASSGAPVRRSRVMLSGTELRGG